MIGSFSKCSGDRKPGGGVAVFIRTCLANDESCLDNERKEGMGWRGTKISLRDSRLSEFSSRARRCFSFIHDHLTRKGLFGRLPPLFQGQLDHAAFRRKERLGDGHPFQEDPRGRRRSFFNDPSVRLRRWSSIFSFQRGTASISLASRRFSTSPRAGEFPPFVSLSHLKTDIYRLAFL